MLDIFSLGVKRKKTKTDKNAAYRKRQWQRKHKNMLKTVWYGFINVCICVTLEVDTANSFIDIQSLLIDG